MTSSIRSFILLNIGVILIASNIHFFLSPNQFATGGASGLSIVLHHFLPSLSLGLILGFVNILLFIVGFIFLGFQFGVKTIYSGMALSFVVWLLDVLVPIQEPLSQDALLQLIMGQTICAIGIVIICNQEASTGGTDLVAMILKKYFSIEIGKGILLCDFAIGIGAMFAFGVEKGLYALFGIVYIGLVIDYLMKQFNIKKEVVVISHKSEVIKEFIVEQLGRGATVHTAKGAFTNHQKEVITTVLTKNEYQQLKTFIRSHDDHAFITVRDMNEIIGTGFSGVPSTK
ncbi:YitT family protein [Bacillus kexueae]|uniref:YitT family protein n=1 Tax=Aeribacillus kexueae TaxID=2078952 RepID=UPI001FAEBF41|nr:YitT family protein [Bacillus kexueae]